MMSQSMYIQKSMSAEIRASSKEVCIFRGVEEDPGTSTQRIAAAEDISVPLVWRILCEQSYPVTAVLTPPDHHTRVVFSQ
jgi:hypothetical protein